MVVMNWGGMNPPPTEREIFVAKFVLSCRQATKAIEAFGKALRESQEAEMARLRRVRERRAIAAKASKARIDALVELMEGQDGSLPD